jgi:hypothetical protein
VWGSGPASQLPHVIYTYTYIQPPRTDLATRLINPSHITF